MSASFRRKRRGDANNLGSLKGTKPWTGGITLTSAGLRDLDAILGGGQSVGTTMLLEEDRWTRDLALCLIKYWCAEAVSHEQALLIPSFQEDTVRLPTSAPSLVEETITPTTVHRQGTSKSQIHSLIDSLPRNLHWDKAAGKAVVEEGASSRPLEILEEEEGDEDAEQGLQIAWQYRKSIQDERLGHSATTTTSKPTSSNVYCHSFDLNGRLSGQDMNRDCIHIFDAQCCDGPCQNRMCGLRLFQTLKQQLKLQPKGKLIRLLLYQASVETASIAVPLLLTYIRSEELPVVLLVTVQSWTCPSEAALVNLRRASDVVLQTEGFASRIHYPPPPEFRHLHGLLLLPKAASIGGMSHFADMTMSKRPPAHVFGLKRDRRKLHVPLLHIPPEDYAGEGGSVGGGGVRSGAGREKATTGCSSGTSVLDF